MAFSAFFRASLADGTQREMSFETMSCLVREVVGSGAGWAGVFESALFVEGPVFPPRRLLLNVRSRRSFFLAMVFPPLVSWV
jgi:hypothetical protein